MPQTYPSENGSFNTFPPALCFMPPSRSYSLNLRRVQAHSLLCKFAHLYLETSQVLNYIDNKGKACQKAHRPLHKASCEINIKIKQCARSYGPETEAMYASFAQWCEDNALAFSAAASSALGISLDRQNACKSPKSLCRLVYH